MEAEPTSGTGKSTGSIAERRAARCGFKPTPRLNTVRFRGVSPLSSPAVRSPFVTIPPGISPTALLDSPVMLLNSQALRSPTTGSFQMPAVEYETMSQAEENANAGKVNHDNLKYAFMFRNQPISPISMSSLQDIDNQMQMEFEDRSCISKREKYTEELQQGRGVAKTATVEAHCGAALHSESKQTHCPDEYLNGEDFLSQQLSEEDQSAEFLTVIGRASEDGYNWRKYGQKQVKGSEFPRSYYKCTYPSCQVKKKVERSLEGQITETVYKGTHHHPKPQPTRRSAFSSSYSISELSDSAVGIGSSINVEGELVGRKSQQGSGDKFGVNLKAEGLEWVSSTSAVTELSDTHSTAQERCSSILIEHPELSSTLASQVTDEDDATQGSMMIGDEGEDDDGGDASESKRRKGESCLLDSNPVSGPVREPRVVVQTVSEVDILDDGYRWRKYGQKVVKGNPNPRSYYKCTHPGCSVRKLVERASHDLKSVITTYEGKHNHEVPRAKNKSQTARDAQLSSTALRSISISKLKENQNLFPSCHENYELLSCRGSASGVPFIGDFPCYEPQLPSLQPLSFGSLASRANCAEANLTFPVSNFDQNLPVQMPISFLGPNIVFCDGLDDHLRPKAGEVQPLLMWQQQLMEGEMRVSMLPVQEQGNADYDSHVNDLSSDELSICSLPMDRFPS